MTEGRRLPATFAATVAGLPWQSQPGGAPVPAAVTLSTPWGGRSIEQARSGYGKEPV